MKKSISTPDIATIYILNQNFYQPLNQADCEAEEKRIFLPVIAQIARSRLTSRSDKKQQKLYGGEKVLGGKSSRGVNVQGENVSGGLRESTIVRTHNYSQGT